MVDILNIKDIQKNGNCKIDLEIILIINYCQFKYYTFFIKHVEKVIKYAVVN